MFKRTAGLVAIGATALSLGLTATAPAQLRVGPNYRLDADASRFRAVDQIGLTVHRTNPQHVVAVNANYLDLRCEASRSLDGGATWSPAVPLVPPAGLSPRCAFHQSVEFGSGQNVYAIVTANKTNASSPDASVVVYKSTDGGLTWGPGVVVMEGGAGTNDPVLSPSAGPSYTRPDLAVEPGATGDSDRVYAVARDFIATGNGPGPFVCGGTTPQNRNPCDVVRVAVSNDSGATYTQKANASPVGVDAADPVPAVINSDGSLTLAWRTTGGTGILQSARTTDQGTTWSAPVDIAVVRNTARSGVDNTHLTPIERPPASGPLNSTTATYPRMAADPANPGRIYLVYSETPSGPTAPPGGFRGADHFINYDARVWFQRSSDNGLTWSTPKPISDATPYPGAQTIQTRHPNVSVSPGGRVNIVWHDRRHWYQGPGERNCTHSHIFCEDIRLGDTYLSYSTNGGTTFSDNIRVSDRSHNNDVGYDTRPASGYWSWGPQVVTVAGGQLLIGWMDTREGNWDTDTEDFYLAKVNFEASGPAPQSSIDEPDLIERAVALSRLGYRGGNEGALVGGPRDPANANLVATPGNAIPGGPASRNASSVVIVNEGDVAGAMAGTVLARANPGPVLLSPPSGLPASVKAEIARVRPARVFLIGDANKLSAAVATEVGLISGLFMPQIIRLDGGSDAATAGLIADQLDYRTATEKDGPGLRPAHDAAVIVNPATPDGAAAVGLAAARRLPILYVDQNSVPAATSTALGSTKLDIDKTLVIGGPSSVSEGVLAQLPGATRLGGADQYETSRRVVEESKARGLPSNVVYVADGSQPMDATLLGGVLARATGILVLGRAPLDQTAAQQAAGFGLTGISRFYLLAPHPFAAPPPAPGPAPEEAAVPPPGAPPPPPAAAGRDTTAPLARLSGATIQKLSRTVTVTITCTSEPCTAVAKATIAVPRVGRLRAKTYTLKSVSVKLAKGVKRKVSLRISTTARVRILRMLRLRRSVSARFTVTVSDAAANKRSLRRTVKFRR